MIRVIISIEDNSLTVHRLVIEVQGQEEINVENCIGEIRAMAVKWATTWVRNVGATVTIRNKKV